MGETNKQKGSSDEMSDNDDLYNQSIDDQGNTVNKETINISPPKMTLYEKEYIDVITSMSNICRTLVWNNNPVNKDRKMKVDEDAIAELCPRIWSLSVELDFASDDDKSRCFL